MTEEMKKSTKVIDVEEMLKKWMQLTPMEKERAAGYMDCLQSTRRYEPKTA